MFDKSELSRFDAQIRMAEGSLRKAKPILDLMSKSSYQTSYQLVLD